MKVSDIAALLIETDPILIATHQLEIKNAGVNNCDIAKEIQEAVGMLKSKKYDLIVSDSVDVIREGSRPGAGVVVGICESPLFKGGWAGVTTYTFTPQQFYRPGTGLRQVLREKFSR